MACLLCLFIRAFYSLAATAGTCLVAKILSTTLKPRRTFARSTTQSLILTNESLRVANVIREYIQYPQDIEVATAYGPIYLSVTNQDHIYADASGNGKHLVFKGDKYSVSLHLVHGCSFEGDWIPMHEGKDQSCKSSSAFYCAKFRAWPDKCPPTYALKIKAEIIRVVNAWVKDQKETLRLAACAYWNNRALDEEKEIKEAEQKLEVLRVGYASTLRWLHGVDTHHLYSKR